jgi:hypothetical protein
MLGTMGFWGQRVAALLVVTKQKEKLNWKKSETNKII